MSADVTGPRPLPASEAGGGIGGALRHRTFRNVWLAGAVDNVGTWLQITGRAWLIYHVTGSTTALGTIYFLAFLPQLLLSQFAGVAVDRFDRRRVLMIGQLLSGVGAALMAVLAGTDTANVANVGALSVVLGVVQIFTNPAQHALVPSLVPKEDLTSAVSLTSATSAASRVVGPLVAGALIPLVGVAWLFILNAASYVVILAVWWRTPVKRQPPMAESGTFSAIVAGARWVRSTPAVAVIILTTLVAAGIGNAYQPIAVAYCTDILAAGKDDLGATYYGLFQAAIGVGSAVGIVALSALGRRAPRRALTAATLGTAASITALGASTWVVLSIALALAIGFFQISLTTLGLAMIQHLSPDEMRGRALSVHGLAWVGPLPIISLFGGMLATAFGTREVIGGVGVLVCLYCLVFLRLARHLPSESLDEPSAEVISMSQDEADGAAPWHERTDRVSEST